MQGESRYGKLPRQVSCPGRKMTSANFYFHHVPLRIEGIELGFAAIWSDQQLLCASLDADAEAAWISCSRSAPDVHPTPSPFPSRLEEQVRAALDGDRVEWSWSASPVIGTPFQREIWMQLARIPSGSTISYGELARRCGRATAARACGSACGKNPLPLRLPCHRVVQADGKIGGFTGDLRVKAQLIARESASATVQLALPQSACDAATP